MISSDTKLVYIPIPKTTGVILNAILENNYGRRFIELLLVRDQIRIDFASTALSLWHKNPLTGVGAGVMPNYAPNRAHNILLTALAEQGLIGVTMIVGLWVTVFLGI